MAALGLVALAGACSENAVLTAPPIELAPTSPLLHLTSGGGPVCGTGLTTPLVMVKDGDDDEDRTTVGTVTVNNVRDHLHVIYTMNPGWTLKTTNAAVVAMPGDLSKRLSRGSNKKLPLFVKHGDGVTSFEYDIMLSDVGTGPGNSLVVAARADVRGMIKKEDDDKDDKKDNDGKKVEGTAWAGSASTSKKAHGVRYVLYTVQTCPTPTPGGGGTPPGGGGTPPGGGGTPPGGGGTPPGGGGTPPGGGGTPPGGTLKGAVTVTFDDGFLTEFTNGYRIMKENGLVGNLAVNGSAIQGGFSAYMTLANVQEMSLNGWAVVNHTWTHADLTTLTDDQANSEILMNRNWIFMNGFRGDWIFVVPYHSWGTRELNIIKQWEQAARGYTAQQFRTGTQFTPETDFLQSWPPADMYKLVADEPFSPGVDIETAKRELTIYLNRARNEGKFLEVIFHAIPDERIADFRAIVQILVQNKDMIRPYDQLITATGTPIVIARQ